MPSNCHVLPLCGLGNWYTTIEHAAPSLYVPLHLSLPRSFFSLRTSIMLPPSLSFPLSHSLSFPSPLSPYLILTSTSFLASPLTSRLNLSPYLSPYLSPRRYPYFPLYLSRYFARYLYPYHYPLSLPLSFPLSSLPLPYLYPYLYSYLSVLILTYIPISVHPFLSHPLHSSPIPPNTLSFTSSYHYTCISFPSRFFYSSLSHTQPNTLQGWSPPRPGRHATPT